MNAIEEALSLMDEKGAELAAEHTLVALRHGGFAVWLPEVVCVCVPWDPVEGDHEHTMTVLFCGGDVQRLAEYGEQWAERGYTHVIWCRGFKAGRQDLQKFALGRWARLVKLLNRHG